MPRKNVSVSPSGRYNSVVREIRESADQISTRKSNPIAKGMRTLASAIESGSKIEAKKAALALAEAARKKYGSEIGTADGFMSENATVRNLTLTLYATQSFYSTAAHG